MAGVGEASAIVGLISTAASLSKAVIDIASKYKFAKSRIESFGQEVGILGNILDQLHRLYGKNDLLSDGGVIDVIVDILDQCSGLFAELETYRGTLYSSTRSVRNVTFLGKTKWVFEEKELEYLRTRVESMKINMLLMMVMQCVHGLQRPHVGGTVENHADQARLLSIQSEKCAKRLQALKNDVVTSTNVNPVINRMSFDTAASVHSIRDSILSLYGHESLYETPSESQDEVLAPESMQFDQARVSRIIEDHIRIIAVVDEEKPDSPLMLPYTFQHSLDSSTASNDEEIELLKVKHFNHRATTELGIFTDFCEDSSDQHQYDTERFVSGFLLRNTCGVTLTESYFKVLSSAVQHYEKGKDWRHYELCITLEHQARHLQLDERPMMVLDSLRRQLPLHRTFEFHKEFALRRLKVPVPWEYVNYMLNAMTYTYPINGQHCCHEVLAAMLQAVNESYVASAYELCLNSQIKELTSRLKMDQKPLALYQEWAQEERMPIFFIRHKDVART